MNTSDFDFHLPEELIAQTPLEKRDASRLLIVDRSSGEFSDQHFDSIIDQLQPGDALVTVSYTHLLYYQQRIDSHAPAWQ